MMRLQVIAAMSAALSGVVLAHPEPNPWVECGVLGEIRPASCQLPQRSSMLYEYAIKYNTTEPLPVQCTFWSVGIRIANKTPYLVYSDNPSQGMFFGGFVFYMQTRAPDECKSPERFRHRYWRLDANNSITTLGSNGCFAQEIPVYCRSR